MRMAQRRKRSALARVLPIKWRILRSRVKTLLTTTKERSKVDLQDLQKRSSVRRT